MIKLSEITVTPLICISIGNISFAEILSSIEYAKNKNAACVEIRFDLIKDLQNYSIYDNISKVISYANEQDIVIIATKRNTSPIPDYYNDKNTIAMNDNNNNEINTKSILKNKRENKDYNNTVNNLNNKLSFLKTLIKMGIKAVDIELDIIEKPLIVDFVKFAHLNRAEVILSVHDFNSSDDLQKALQYYLEASYLGADFFKMAVMTNTNEDALNILSVCAKINRIMLSNHKNNPKFIIFGMGEKGKLTRLLSLKYGSFLSYCPSLTGITAPGQMDIDSFRRLYNLILNC